MSFIAIIPARYASTRLPGKPLADIHGKPMVVHVMERARESGASRVIVATDHPEVAKAVEAAGGEVCMTSPDHHSGTERLAEVIAHYGFADDQIIVNVQGDEPLIPPVIVRQVAENLAGSQAGMATLAVPIESVEEAFNPNAVKVVMDAQGYALYFHAPPFRGTVSVSPRRKRASATVCCVISASTRTAPASCVATSAGRRASWNRSSCWNSCACCGTVKKSTWRSRKRSRAWGSIRRKISSACATASNPEPEFVGAPRNAPTMQSP